MSERFSKKEFIKATRITFPSRRQILIFSGFILGIAVLFFVFPPERYPQTSNKWYIFMLSIYCIFLIRCLFRKTKEDSPFHRCPNCGHSIIISIDNRAECIAKDTGLPIILREDIPIYLKDQIFQSFKTEIKLPWENIKRWKEQFN